MNNRLNELRNMNQGVGHQDIQINFDQNVNQLQQQDLFIESQSMQQFKNKINQINECFDNISINSDNVKQLQKQYAQAITSTQNKNVSKQLQGIMQQNNMSTQAIHRNLEEIGKEIARDKVNYPNEPETQMKINIYNQLLEKSKYILQDSQTSQTSFQEGMKKKIIRQAKAINSDLTNDQLEDICENPEKADQMLQEQLYGQASIELQNKCADISERFADIKRLGQSVQALHQLFVDMSLLLTRQGELIDNIKIKTEKANEYVEKAEGNLDKAKKHQQAARKKMCCIILVGVIALAIICGLIGGLA